MRIPAIFASSLARWVETVTFGQKPWVDIHPSGTPSLLARVTFDDQVAVQPVFEHLFI